MAGGDKGQRSGRLPEPHREGGSGGGGGGGGAGAGRAYLLVRVGRAHLLVNDLDGKRPQSSRAPHAPALHGRLQTLPASRKANSRQTPCLLPKPATYRTHEEQGRAAACNVLRVVEAPSWEGRVRQLPADHYRRSHRPVVSRRQFTPEFTRVCRFFPSPQAPLVPNLQIGRGVRVCE